MKKVLSIIIVIILVVVSPVYALDSNGVIYDNSTSGSSATNVESALNDLYSKLNEKQTEINTIKNIGNATADKILSGYTAYVKGNTITGSIPSKGATTYTPGTVNQTIASGQYLSGAQTIKGDSNLVASNIAKGKSIFGISGTYTSDANAVAGNILSGKTAYVNGNKITGNMPIRGGSTRGTEVGYNSTNTYFTFPYGYYPAENHFSQTNSSEVYMPNSAVASAIGLTADKLVSGQTVLGITGTGGGYKAYTFNSVAATVSSSRTFKYGTWVGLADKNETVSFSANLGFKPSEVVACELKLRGNYSSTIETSNDHDFSFNRGSNAKWYKNELETSLSGNYMSNSDNVSVYADTYTNCKVSGSSIIFQLRYVVSGATSNVVSTRADKFYLSGTLVYK